MNRGVGQSSRTCWFFSALNIFLLSDEGLKLLWKRLQEVHQGFNSEQKAFFNAPNFTAPCPVRNVTQTPSVYFWKFMDDYLCAIGGPGRLHFRAGLNKNLLKNIVFQGAAPREARGLAPAYAGQEIGPILNYAGISHRIISMIDPTPVNASWMTPVLVYKWNEEDPKMGMKLSPWNETFGQYTLMGASLSVYWKNSNVGHVIALVMQNGKGYLFDSDNQKGLMRVDWNDPAKLVRKLKQINPELDENKVYFNFVVYANKNVTNKISPVCRRVYKPLSNANKLIANNRSSYLGELFTRQKNQNLSKIAAIHYTPALRAEIVKRYGAMPQLTRVTFNSIVKNAKSANGALQTLRNIKSAGYRYNKTGSNYIKFMNDLANKFKVPPPKEWYTEFLRRRYNTKNQTLARFTNEARNRTWYVNKNSPDYKKFIVNLNRKYSTRSATVKRKRSNNNNNNR